MKVFVTGGSGFLGRHLVRALVARGDSVSALARTEEAAAALGALGARPVAGDLSDVEALTGGMGGCLVVYHCAALAADWGPLEDFVAVNVTGTANVLAAAAAAKVAKLVHVSTEAVLVDGSPLVGVTESRPLPEAPLEGYPSTKAEAERQVLAASSARLATCVVRPRLIWGHDDSTVLPRLVEAADRGSLRFIDGGEYLTSTCHVDNVVEGMLLAAERGLPGRVFFLTDGEPVQVRSFMESMLRAVGREPRAGSLPGWAADLLAGLFELLWRWLPLRGSPPLTRLAIELMGREVTVEDRRARQELGYRGRVSRDEGLASLTGPPGLATATGVESAR